MSPDLDTDVSNIVRRQFATARRGLDQDEVRAYLRELADLVDGLRRREAELRARAEAAEARTPRLEDIDEHRLVEMLGEETARILAAGRVASSDIRRKAEEAAERLIAEANEEAHRIRSENDTAMLRRRGEVHVELEALKAEAAAELDRRRAEGAELVNEIRRSAQAEADELVDEAQVVRRRLLGDLARRRRAAREQLERLNAARERLLAAYDVVRRTVDEATSELTVALPEAKLAGDSASRRINEEPEPTVDDLEGLVTMARIAGLIEPSTLDPETTDLPETTGAKASPAVPAPSEGPERLEPAPERGAGFAALSGAGSSQAPPPPDPEPEPEPQEPEAEVAEPEPEEPEEPEEVFEEDEYVEYDDEGDWAEEDEEAEEEAAAAPSMASSVEALFARIKADTEAVHDDEGTVATLADEDTYDDEPYDDWSDEEEPAEPHDGPAAVPIESYDRGAVAHLLPEQFDEDEVEDETPVEDVEHEEPVEVEDHHAEPDEPEPDHDDHHDDIEPEDHVDDYASEPVAGDEDLVERRDTALAQIEHDLNRRLKRVLADEQNEVLDLLRRTKPSSSDELLASLGGGHTARYTDAARDELGHAASWGAASVGGEPDGSYEALAVELAQAVVEPLRERIAGSFRDTGGELDEVTGRLRSLYREWKGQRIAAAVRHYAVAAYAQGAYGSMPDGTPLRWLVDRTSDPCPDADDNALAGAVCKGEAFPTGDHCPPAHLGCRCMVVPAE